MSTAAYSTSMGRSYGGRSAVPLNADDSTLAGGNWLPYVFYFLAALMVVWSALFAMIRAGAIGPNHWLYNKIKWIPGLGEDSIGRTPTEGTSGSTNTGGS